MFSSRACRGSCRLFSGSISRLFQPRFLLTLAVLLLSFVTVMIVWSWLISGSTSLTFFSSPTPSIERDYGVVIDAGSSSSKLHLFQWPPHDGDPAKLLTIKPMMDELGDPLTKKVEPGIATFSSSPETAFTSLQPLLDYALDHIPVSHHQHTSLYIFCTAGMRLLSQEDRDRIISVLKTRVADVYPFYLPKDSIQVISGKMEGVFSWIAINYLVGRLSPESHHHGTRLLPTPSEGGGLSDSSGAQEFQSIQTVGSLDLGGASLQVAFEVPSDADIPADLTMDINLGCGVNEGNQHKHRIFVSTYLGYGSNEARSRYYQLLLKTHLQNSNHSMLADPLTHLHSLRDPCAPLGSTDNVTVKGHMMKVRGLGDFRGCKKALVALLRYNNKSMDPNRGSGSADKPASLQTPCGSSCGSYLVQDFRRPSLSLKYESLNFYGTSEFWYTMRDVLRIGGHYTAYSYERAATKYCQTSWWTLLDRFHKRLYGNADFYRLRSQCMKSAWLSVILHDGLGFSRDSLSLHSVAHINGQSVQWPLGALIYNTRFLPLREIQLHQLQAPPVSPTQLNYFLQSSFLLPFCTVVAVVILLLCCRHRRKVPPYLPSVDTGSNSIHRTQSLNTFKVHKRGSSYTSASSLQLAKMGGSSQVETVTAATGGGGGSGFGMDWDYGRSKFMV